MDAWHRALNESVERLRAWEGQWDELAAPALDDAGQQALNELTARLQDNFPFFHPRYAGQMLKPPHPVAWVAQAVTSLVNPNNHALDGGPATAQMEKEAITELKQLFGWPAESLGHLTAGGTMANLEALWIARELHPDRGVAFGRNAHYTHERVCRVLGIQGHPVDADASGRMDMSALEQVLAAGEVGTVVVTPGTTGLGAVDPVHEIVALAKIHGVRVHADAAYGGFFRLLAERDPPAVDPAPFLALAEVDSLVVDPHKHGLQPYGCGCILFRDPTVAVHYRHDSAYTYFTSDDLHLGEISLECSRAGAAAVALWATQRLLPPQPGGEFAAGLAHCREAAVALHRALADDPAFLTLMPPDLDIVVWAPSAGTAGAVSRASRRCFEQAAGRGLHLALMELPSALAARWWPAMEFDEESVTVLRSVLMKPEHDRALPAILETLRAAAA